MAKRASKRVAVEKPLQFAAPELEPQARPVDTFVRPRAPAPYHQSLGFALANALKVGSDITAQVGDWVDDDAKEQARIEFEKSAYKPFDEAVEKGVIQPGQSPAFRREWNKLHMRQQVYTLNDTVRSELAEDAQWIGEEDEAKRNAMFHAKRREVMDRMGLMNMPPDIFVDVAAPMLDNEEAQFRQQDAQRRAGEAEDKVIAGIGQEIGTYVSDAEAAGGKVDPKKLADTISAITAPFAKGQRFKKRINEQIVDTLLSSYKDTGNYAYVRAISNIGTGPGSTLGATPWVKEKIVAAMDYVERQGREDQRWRFYLEDRARVEATREGIGNYLTAVEEFGVQSQQVTDAIVAMRDHDPQMAAQLEGLRHQRLVRGRTIVEDQRVAAQLKYDILTGKAGPKEILAAADDGLVDGENMLSWYNQVQGSDGKAAKVSQSREVQLSAQDVESGLKKMWEANGFPLGPDVEINARDARRDFTIDATQALVEAEAEKDAPLTFFEKEEIIGKLRTQYTRGDFLQRYLPTTFGGKPMPEGQQNLMKVNPVAPRERGEAADAAAAATQRAEDFRAQEAAPQAQQMQFAPVTQGAIDFLHAQRAAGNVDQAESEFGLKFGPEALEKYRYPKPSGSDVAALQSSPTPEVIAQFNEVFGPGAAEEHLQLGDDALQTQAMP